MLLAEPQTTLPSTRTQWLDRHLNRVCVLLELTATQYHDAEGKYQSVGKWLSAEGSSLAIFAPEIYPQGSMFLGTTVRPWGRMEYDLDLVCQLHWCANQPPLTVYDWVYGRMNANETYAEMLEKLKRCLRLNYAGAFHMDILPACPNDQVGNGSIIVPDCKLECWMHSHPKGFAAWFFEKCRLRDELAERMLKGSVEPLPSPVPSEYKFPLQRIVQLMKRHRDVYFRGGHDIARSVILTTLAGQFYQGQRSLSLALESVLDGIHAELERHPTVPRIPNPVHAVENFADTWDQEKYDRFKAYIQNFRQGLKALLYPSLSEERIGIEKAAGRLGELLGAEKVTEAIRIEAKEMNDYRGNGGLAIGSSGILTGISQARSIGVPRNQFFGR
ncbi:MAG TPA: nucleotidyltransferase [Candidatus Dormibacteraeota bacterium]|nr:nucleotidyltransferase [Terriglobales bacterium]HYM79403.1 nucleotidyltransferase [Candidatus Dormibacteraeota bacterium]